MHGASAAEAGAATKFCALQIDGVAEDPKQRRVAVNIDLKGVAIDVKRIVHNQPRHSMYTKDMRRTCALKYPLISTLHDDIAAGHSMIPAGAQRETSAAWRLRLVHTAF